MTCLNPGMKPDSVNAVKIRGGNAGVAKFLSNPARENLMLPSVPLPFPLTTVMMRSDGAASWSRTSRAPARSEEGALAAKQACGALVQHIGFAGIGVRRS